MKRLESPRWPTALAAGVGVAAVVALLQALRVFTLYEYKTRDLRMKWSLPEKGGHPDIVMVYYSEESLGLIRQRWNSDFRERALIGNLFRAFSGKPSAKKPAEGPGAPRPTAVLYDFFTLCDPAEPPENLLQELGEQENVYLAVPFSSVPRKYEYAPDPFLAKFAIEVDSDGSVAPPEYLSVLLPTEDISNAAHRVGDVRSFTDEDGVDRRYHLLCRFRGRHYPSFALAALLERERTRKVTLRARTLSVGSVSVPVDSEGAILLRYYRPGATFRENGAYAVVNGRLAYDKNGRSPEYDPKDYSGKIVIVGATAAGLLDLRVTPVSRLTPGPEIHAVAIANLLNRDWLRPVPPRWSYALLVLLALATAFVTRYTPALAGLGAAVALAAAYGGVSLLLFRSRWVIDVAPQIVAVFGAYAVTSAVNYLYEGRQKARVKRIFQQHVSAQVAEKILKNLDDLKTGGERKILTVFFMDFAGFTTLSEKLEPEELVRLINQYHETAANEIFRQEGTLDKFIGDAIMAFWGDPIEQPDHTVRACRAAIALQDRLKSLANELRGHGLPDIKARVGINTGVVVVANVGSKERHNYTAMGNDVNLASRLEGVNKEFGTDILISDSTYAGAREFVEVRELALIVVKGKTQAVRIFEVLGEKGRTDPERVRMARRFEEGIRLYRARNWKEAKAVFEELGDRASKIYAGLCDHHADHPPAGAWQGEYVMEHK